MMFENTLVGFIAPRGLRKLWRRWCRVGHLLGFVWLFPAAVLADAAWLLCGCHHVVARHRESISMLAGCGVCLYSLGLLSVAWWRATNDAGIAISITIDIGDSFFSVLRALLLSMRVLVYCFWSLTLLLVRAHMELWHLAPIGCTVSTTAAVITYFAE